jgi:hypothetical protein
MASYLLFVSRLGENLTRTLSAIGAKAPYILEPTDLPRCIFLDELKDGRLSKATASVLLVSMDAAREGSLRDVPGLVAWRAVTPVEKDAGTRRFREVILSIEPDCWVEVLAALSSSGFILPIGDETALMQLSEDMTFITGRSGLTIDEIKAISGVEEAAEIVRVDLPNQSR